MQIASCLLQCIVNCTFSCIQFAQGSQVARAILKAPLASAAGVLSGPSTLPAVPDETGRLALVLVHPDFEADGLRLWQGQSFEARIAPLSPVEELVRVRPAASPQTASQGMTIWAHEGVR